MENHPAYLSIKESTHETSAVFFELKVSTETDRLKFFTGWKVNKSWKDILDPKFNRERLVKANALLLFWVKLVSKNQSQEFSSLNTAISNKN